MSTRSFICMQVEPNKVRGIYCHYDGYPEHVGKILDRFHRSAEAAENLVNGCQIRSFDHDGTVDRFGSNGTVDYEEYEYAVQALDSGFDYAYQFDPRENRWICWGRDTGIHYEDIIEYDIPQGEPA